MNFKQIFILASIVFISQNLISQTQTDIDDTPGSRTFTVPSGVTQLIIEVWGAGGKGGNASKSGGNNTASAGGGGGGAYNTATITVNPGQIINYTVGAGATTTSPGGTSTATDGSTTVNASGGNSASNAIGGGTTTAGATGGSTGTFTGGDGASGIIARSGGGGSSAGTSSNGTNATTQTGATAPSGGGNGGNGVINSDDDGAPGVAPGGGGGGARASGGGNRSSTGGNGANGRVSFTYTITPNTPPTINLVNPTSTSITITEGDTVNFEWTGSDSDGTIVSGTWRPTTSTAFADATGSPGAGPFTASHVYNTAGTFTARVQVEDDDAATVFIDITVDVQAPQPCDGNVFISAFTPTTDVLAEYFEVPEQLNLYTDGTDNYSFGVGTDNNLLLEAFQTSGPLNFAIEKLADRVELRRAGNSGQGTNGEERHILFFEQDASYSGSSKNFNGEFFDLMEDALVDTSINRGADNVFNNSGGTNVNNIERIDYIFEEGVVVPDPPSEGGFPVFERGGNDEFVFGVISQLDSNLDPSEYTTIISYDSGDWTPTGYSITSSVLSGFPKNSGNLIETADLSSQDLDVIFVSFDDMGLNAGDIVYGYSLAGADVTTDCTEFLDFSNSSFFPQNTGSGDGGLDLLSGGSFSKTAFIHTSTGWYQGDDPNLVTTDCDDTLVVSGGTANINSDKTFNNISATAGDLDLNNNTMTLCGDIFTILPFDIESGTIEMIGPDKQFIGGNDTVSFDELIVNNANGVEVDTSIEINGVLTVDDGDFTTNGNVLLPCFFTEPTTGDFENGDHGQIGPIVGNIVGDVSVEQCYPGRRAYRLVTSSVSTTNSIQDNWQENADAYNDIPVPSTTQEDGIPYGFGTHITGLDHLASHSPTDSGTDQIGGLDWQPSGDPSMFEFNESTQSFDPVLVTESGGATETATLESGKTYAMIIRGSREVNLELNASPTSNTKLRSSGVTEKGFSFTSTVSNQDFLLVGNPFHAIVDMRKVVYGDDGVPGGTGSNADNSGLGRFLYAYDPTLGTNPNDSNSSSVLEGNRGAYVTIDLQELISPTPSGSEMSHFLQAYQGVFIKAEADNPTVDFEETDKAVDQDQINVFSTTPVDKIGLMLYDQYSYTNNNNPDDYTSIIFNQNYNNDIDSDDALKFINPDENLGRIEGSDYLVYESRAMPQAGEVLPLYSYNYRSTDYTMVVKVDGLLNNTVIFYDNYTNTETILNNDTSTAISFRVDPANPASEDPNRFELRFKNSTLGSTEFDLQGISVYPNPANNILNIDLGDNIGRFDNLELYDVNGRLIATQDLDNQALNAKLNVNSYNPGVYILKVSSDAEQFSKKVIIR